MRPPKQGKQTERLCAFLELEHPMLSLMVLYRSFDKGFTFAQHHVAGTQRLSLCFRPLLRPAP